MKKLLCVLLSLIMLVSTVICVSAKQDNSGSLKMIAYNVSGIPLVGDFQGTTFTFTNDRARKIGALLNSTDVDFIGTEEDFNSHKYLAEQMTNYPYRSFTSGGLAQGQGQSFRCFELKLVNTKVDVFGCLLPEILDRSCKITHYLKRLARSTGPPSRQDPWKGPSQVYPAGPGSSNGPLP